MIRHPVALARYALAAAVAMLFALAGPAFAQDGPSPILSGPTTVDQAVAFSQVNFAAGSTSTAILAREDDFSDSLASGALQAELNAPLLLTNTNLLSPQTGVELARLGVDEVIILGGEMAVGPSVVTALEALGIDVNRVAGGNRAETAVRIVETYFPNATEVMVARADAPEGNPTAAFADSITLAGYSAISGIPVLLTNGNMLNPETAEALGSLPIVQATVVGGTQAISPEVMSAIGGAISASVAASTDTDAPHPFESVVRLGGSARDVTAIALQNDLGYASAADAGRVLLIEGYSDTAWAAGFAGAVQSGNQGAHILSNGDTISQASLDFIRGTGVPLICAPGTTQTACDTAFAAINADEG